MQNYTKQKVRKHKNTQIQKIKNAYKQKKDTKEYKKYKNTKIQIQKTTQNKKSKNTKMPQIQKVKKIQ